LSAGVAQSALQRAVGWTAGVQFPEGARDFTSPRPAVVTTQPPIQLVPGALSRGGKANKSPPSSSYIKNDGAIPPLPHSSSA
jgi:hypothetical protein